MSKRKGLGRDVNSSIEVMDILLAALKEFHRIPLKRGILSSKLEDGEKILKAVNDTMEKAFNLSMMVEDLKSQIGGAKVPTGNSRFASLRIIEKFLNSEE